MKNKNIAAFFDFDLTITNYDSFRSFIKFLYIKHPQFGFYIIIFTKFNF